MLGNKKQKIAMGNKNKKKQQQQHQMEAMARRDAKIRQLPTIYTFNFKDVPSEVYAKTLEAIFSDPQFADAVRNRNELVRAANRIPQGAPQMAPLIKAIQEKDAKLANAIYALLVQVNLHSEITYDFLSFGHLSRYYVDYSRPGIQEKVDQLNTNLDKITFLSETLENLLTQVKGDMLEIFKGASEFQQFDGVMASLRQLSGFFDFARKKDEKSKDYALYYEYADSINAYMNKRMLTYSAKYRKLHPTLPGFTQEQMVEAINLFFGEKDKFNESFISATDSGGKYIDAVKLSFNIDEEQTKKLDKLVPKPKEGNSIQKYCLNVTDAIMLYYAQQKGFSLK
jgi:hypothetical protein